MTITDMQTLTIGAKLKAEQTGAIFTVVDIDHNGFDLVSDVSGKHLVSRVNCDAANRPAGWTTPEPTSHMVRWTEPLASKVASTISLA